MEIVDTSKLLFGITWTLFGVGLIFAKIDAENLKTKSHTMPGISLFRIPTFKWAIILALIASGIIFIFQSLVWNF